MAVPSTRFATRATISKYIFRTHPGLSSRLGSCEIHQPVITRSWDVELHEVESRGTSGTPHRPWDFEICISFRGCGVAERTRWENHGIISREAEEKWWGTISHGCPFPTFNITHRISERNETNSVEKTSVSFSEESEEFSSMTFRGKGLLSKARKGVGS